MVDRYVKKVALKQIFYLEHSLQAFSWRNYRSADESGLEINLALAVRAISENVVFPLIISGVSYLLDLRLIEAQPGPEVGRIL